jgi:hypothetical protein
MPPVSICAAETAGLSLFEFLLFGVILAPEVDVLSARQRPASYSFYINRKKLKNECVIITILGFFYSFNVHLEYPSVFRCLIL